jgi:L-aspartate oxidase
VDDEKAERVLRAVQALMWRDVGVVRDGSRLRTVIGELEGLRSELPAGCSRRACEAANVLDTGLLIARSALAREESRGAHYRTDFPEKREEFCKHSVVRDDRIVFEQSTTSCSGPGRRR